MSLEDAEQEAAEDARGEGSVATRLARDLERLARSERQLKALLLEAHEQIAARDEALDRIRAERDEMHQLAVGAHAHVAEIKRTKVWRAGTTIWRVRDWLLSRQRR